MTETEERIADLASRADARVAVAESLTGGALSSALAKATNAQKWLAGGVVAYQMATKQRVLGVAAGVDPCSAACATQLAVGVRSLLPADIAVAVTGVGGPDPEDGHPAGEVFIAVSSAEGERWWHQSFSGSPADIVEQTVRAALERLLSVLEGATNAG